MRGRGGDLALGKALFCDGTQARKERSQHIWSALTESFFFSTFVWVASSNLDSVPIFWMSVPFGSEKCKQRRLFFLYLSSFDFQAYSDDFPL